jgi:lipoyl(octanoyl) transferase
MNNLVKYQWIEGKTYQEVWDYQTGLHQELIAGKKSENKNESEVIHHLLLCQHAPVYTLGKSGHVDNLLLDATGMQEKGVEFFKINRGGDITYHGPGQITGYPILDMECFYMDVHRYVRDVEQVIINTLADFGIQGLRIEKYTGVWVEEKSNPGFFRKICAIGIHFSRWVTLHGFALNVQTDLSYFNHIIPCGIRDENLAVTSMEVETGKKIELKEVEAGLKTNFAKVFGFLYI